MKRTPLKARNRDRETADAELSNKTLKRDGYTYLRCGNQADHAHHVVMRSARPDLAHHLPNLASLCAECHRHVHNEGTSSGWVVSSWNAETWLGEGSPLPWTPP